MSQGEDADPYVASPHGTVLVAAASNELRKNLVDLLEMWGYSTRVAESLEEAEQMAGSREVSIEILDGDYARQTLTGVVNRITRRRPDLPILVIIPAHVEQIHGAIPADERIAVLVRPFEAHDLRKRLDELMGRTSHDP